MIDLKELLSFRTMVTPKVITILYWIMLVAIVPVGIIAMLFLNLGFVTTLFGMAAAAVLTRISCERTIVAFKSNEYLRKIAEKE